MVRKNVTTLNLSGETAVQFDKGYNCFFVNNLSGNDVLISMSGGITEGSDGVIIVPEGSSAGTMHGYSADTVYIKGAGKVQVMGTYSAFNPFKKPAKGGEIKAVSGSNITITNSAVFPLLALTAYGRSRQGYASHGGVPLGKNLFDSSLIKTSTNSGVTCRNNNDGTFSFSGTLSSGIEFTTFAISRSSAKSKTVISEPGMYTISGIPSGTSGIYAYINLYYNGEGQYSFIHTNGGNTKKITSEMLSYDDFRFDIGFMVNGAFDEQTYYIQLEKNNVPTSFEPYYSNPNPDCPVPIESIGDGGSLTVTTCGKNLIDHTKLRIKEQNGVEIIRNDDGTFTFSGSKSNISRSVNVNWEMTHEESVRIFNPGTYTMSGVPNEYGWKLAGFLNIVYNGQTVNNLICTASVVANLNTGTITEEMWSAEDFRVTLGFYSGSEMEIANDTVYLQIERGDTATPYEPYRSTSATAATALPLRGIPVDSGGNYTDSNGQGWVCDTINYNYTTAVKHQRISAIDSYNGEAIGDNYISTTGGLNVGASVIYPAETVTETPLTADEINQLRNLETFDGITTVYNNGNADMSVEYLTSKAVSKAVMPIIAALRGDNNA